MVDFRMPSLGADMEAGTLVEWLVKPGAPVKRGDVVAVVETDKGAIDVEIWQGGVVDELKVQPGTTVPVGTVLATVREDGAAAASAPGAPSAPVVPSAPSAPMKSAPPTPPVVIAASPPAAALSPPPVSAPPPPPVSALPPPVSAPTPFVASAGHVRASPSARQLARERGVDLAAVHGTGPSGAITRADVEHAAAPATPAAVIAPPAVTAPPATTPLPSVKTPPRRTPAAAMRQAIAAAMARSKREIPHYYVETQIDVSALQSFVARENLRRPVAARLLVAAPLLKALALALRQFPELNGTFTDGEFHPADAVHLGFAISLRQSGLVAPALHDCDRKSLGELQAALADLIQRARAGSLRSSELGDSTITVTSLGERGVETVYGIIYPPQVAIVGLGKICERPWADNGMLGVRPVLRATLAADHRVSDGHRGALFLATFAQLLAEPEKL
ncbi:MAG TPA: dihydrolipoamide acetyltransferase family protein [Polyangia bacterium]